MTHTMQAPSTAIITETIRDNTVIPETEDNLSLMVSVFDGLNNLCVKLNRLDYVMKRKIMEINLHQNLEERK